MTELECIARKHGTDKVEHQYCRHYERMIGYMRYLPITLIEIGVGNGASLRMWREWMPKAQIYGLDTSNYEATGEDRIHVIQGDQKNNFDLEMLAQQSGPSHVVVDDGSHNADDQKVTFTNLWPKLVNQGWYIIEDVFGIGSCVDLDAIARFDGDIAELHLITESRGDILLFLKKR